MARRGPPKWDLPDLCRRNKLGHDWRDTDAEETDCQRCGMIREYVGRNPRGRRQYRYSPVRKWQEGTRVRLVSIYPGDYETDPVPPGTGGTVVLTNREGTTIIDWDSGIRLGALAGFDVIEEETVDSSDNERAAAAG